MTIEQNWNHQQIGQVLETIAEVSGTKFEARRGFLEAVLDLFRTDALPMFQVESGV